MMMALVLCVFNGKKVMNSQVHYGEIGVLEATILAKNPDRKKTKMSSHLIETAFSPVKML